VGLLGFHPPTPYEVIKNNDDKGCIRYCLFVRQLNIKFINKSTTETKDNSENIVDEDDWIAQLPLSRCFYQRHLLFSMLFLSLFPYVCYSLQCSGSGSVGLVGFRASRIR
jgi:hypothetical protein